MPKNRKKIYKPIIRNLDESGRILTYSVEITPGYMAEYNTLKKARIMAIIGYQDIATGKIDYL